MSTWNDALLERVHREHGLERAGGSHQMSGLPLRGHNGALLEALVVPAQLTSHVQFFSLLSYKHVARTT